MWPREELVTAERTGRNCKRKPRKSKKPQNFQTKENLNKKRVYFRQKEGW